MSNKIAIIMAMQGEADPVIQKLGLKPIEVIRPRLPVRLFMGSLGSKEICLAVNGKDPKHGVDLIHSQPAVLTANYVAENFSPDLMVSAGTAGGLQKRGAQIGDVYVSRGPVCFHDRRCPIPGFLNYGVGSYAPLEFSVAGFKFGRVSSGDSLYMSVEEQAQFEANDAEVKDMEAAAVAWVASLYEIPFVAVKSITDLIDDSHKVEEQFLKNFSLATANLSAGLCKFLTLI